MPVWLVVLFAAAFVLHTDDYVIAGILPEIAAGLEVAEGAAGQLITAFSLTVAVAAPVAAVLLARVPRRTVFVVGLLVFVAANTLAAFATGYPMLLALRVVAALAAAAVTPALFSFVGDHAPPERTGRYLAVVSLGVVGSISAGVPVGTWIGGAYGWRATFAAVAAAGAVALVAVCFAVPRERRGRRAPSLAVQVRALREPSVVLVVVANGVLMTGSLMLLTYLAPYLAETSGAGVDQRAVAFSLSGVAGVAGIVLGGVVTDRWGASRALAVGITAIVFSMLGLWVLWTMRPVSFPLVAATAMVWAAFAFFNAPAIQARLFGLAGGAAQQVLAFNTTGTYLGVAAGGAIGGLVLEGVGVGGLPLAAAGVGLVALGILFASNRVSDRA